MPNDSTPVAPVTLWREHYYMAAVVNGVKEPEFSYQQRANETFAFPDSPWLALPADVLTALIEALKFYAAQSSWCESYSAVTMLRSRSETDNDKGAIARAALAALEALEAS